jgi:hypothetical protein
MHQSSADHPDYVVDRVVPAAGLIAGAFIAASGSLIPGFVVGVSALTVGYFHDYNRHTGRH